jgi:hypothetical protein
VRRWLLPSFADCFFLVLLGLLGFSSLRNALLRDADTGWHIRTGEWIWTTRSIPRTDLFSYTRWHAPWCDWEWLYDLLIAGVHHFLGLRGVVWFTAVVLAATFALMFHFVQRRSGNLLLAIGLTLLAAGTAQVHMLARPHVLSWLFAVLWMEILCRYEEGSRRLLFLLPPLMVLWVNVHGGFVLGLMLPAIFLAGSLGKGRRSCAGLGAALAGCGLATLLTPYGYHLPVHVYQYLTDRFLMDHIDEFASPNFHLPVYGFFEALLLLTVVAAGLGGAEITVAGRLTLVFSVLSGLYAVRSLPTSAILMVLVLARPLGAAAAACGKGQAVWLDLSRSLGEMEADFRGHAWVWISLACSVISLWPSVAAASGMPAVGFDEERVPVKALDYLLAGGVPDHLFSSDDWSGYLIYRLYPRTRVFVDDRHDFYGRSFLEEYVGAMRGSKDWQAPLDRYRVRWALLPTGCALASLLRQSRAWHVQYEDGVAALFSR